MKGYNREPDVRPRTLSFHKDAQHTEKTAVFNKRYWENWLTTLPCKNPTQILVSLNLHKNQFQMDPGPQSKT